MTRPPPRWPDKLQPVLRMLGMLALLGGFVWLVLFLTGLPEDILMRDYPAPPAERPGAQDTVAWRTHSENAIEGFKQWSLMQTAQTYEWQEYSTRVLFWVSILISICGICFSLWQFLEAGETERRSAEADEIEIKNEYISLAFKSRSLASLMLFVSLAYLVLYSTLIYPIDAGPDEALKALVELSGSGAQTEIPPPGQSEAAVDLPSAPSDP